MIRFGKCVIGRMCVLLCVGGRGRLVWRFGVLGRKMMSDGDGGLLVVY